MDSQKPPKLLELALPVRPLELKELSIFVKHAMDYFIAGFGLIVLAPFFLAVAVLIKLESAGPVLYKQERVGKAERYFLMYKFRSMKMDAESDLGPVWASSADSRCTRIGRFLRRTHIDELPQLVNVIKGEMSLVGPRPERPHFVRQFADSVDGYRNRHRAKTGVTGLAQVNDIKHLTVEETTRFDNEYIDNWSLSLDFKILVLTVRELLLPRSH